MPLAVMGFLPSNVGKISAGNSPKSSIEDSIKRLEKERDKYQNEKGSSDSRLLDRKIGNLEDRINNLRERLDKIRTEDGECKTCENRKYQDESDDPGVSFKSASKISSGSAEAAVRGHEQEHVTRNQAKAERENKEVVYQSVIIKRAICPECGDSYVSGGETTTMTRSKPEQRFNVGIADNKENGTLLDILV
mgnify:FL=1